MYIATSQEFTRNERLRQAPKRRCAACGGKLSMYAAASRQECNLCLSRDREAIHICASRLEAAYRDLRDPSTDHIPGTRRRRLAIIRADALHEALWHISTPEPPEGLLVAGREPAPIPTGARLLVASRQRVREVWWENDAWWLASRVLPRLHGDSQLYRLGYASFDEGVSTPFTAFAIFPRIYFPLSDLLP